MTLILSKAGRRYGYRQNPPDPRDYGLMHLSSPISAFATHPPSTANQKYLGPVRDQGDEGSCTGHAGVGNLDFLWNKFRDAGPYDFSPAFLYYMARFLDGDPDEDGGSTGRSICAAMQRYGVCLESQDPYVAGQYAIPPTSAQSADASLYKSGAYHVVGAVWDIKSCLASGYPAMLGFNVYESFEDKIGADGLMPTPDFANEQLLGGHEVLIFDYDDNENMADGTTGGFKVRNSWGSSWGLMGNFWMSYKQAADSRIVLDMMMQHLGMPWKAKSA